MTVKTEDASTVLTVCQSVLRSRFSFPISLRFKICICHNNKYQLSRKDLFVLHNSKLHIKQLQPKPNQPTE